MKVDLYNHENRYNNWKETYSKRDIEDISKSDSDLIKQFINDMEIGENVSLMNKKGGRSFARLNTLREKVIYIFKLLREHYNVTSVRNITSTMLNEVFTKMRNGQIKTRKGTTFKSTSDYVKIFKSFYHWYMKINRKTYFNYQDKLQEIKQETDKKKIAILKKELAKMNNGVILQDICEDLDSNHQEKPRWVYLDETKINKLIEKADNTYKPLLLFMFDSGARVTETFSILVSDISQERDNVFCHIRDEISKGGNCGRKIKLMLSGKQILDYIKDNGLEESDYLFSKVSNFMSNQYIRELAKKLYGEKMSQAGELYSKMSLYDLRHCSSCFWLQRYKKNSQLQYKFGWKSEKYIWYYSEFLGLTDKITEEDLYTDISKNQLEKQVEELRGMVEQLQKQRYEELQTINKNIVVKI